MNSLIDPARPAIVGVWLLVLAIVSYVLYRAGWALFRAQSIVEADKSAEMEKRWGWTLPAGQFTYGVAIFLVALYAGGDFFTFLAGGLVIALVYSSAHQLRSLIYYRDLARPNAARGTLWVSRGTLLRGQSNVYVAGAVVCILLYALLQRLPLLGGSLFLAAMGIQYHVAARRADRAA